MDEPLPAIARERPDTPEVRVLLDELNASLSALYPAESNHQLSVRELSEPDVAFWVVRDAGAAIGCGAMRRIAPDTGEVKRMYTVPAAQGRGIGRLVLETIEAEALHQGLATLVLETGGQQSAALHLYRSQGFAERGPYLDYPDDGVSVFMEKRVSA